MKLFLTVLWLSAQRLALRKIRPLAALLRMHGFPPFDHLDPALDDSITEVCELALVHWTSRIQRFPGRAHGKQGWKRKEHCGTLSDLYEEQAKAAKQAARACGSRVDSSDDEGGGDSDDDEIAGTDSGEEDNGGEESSYTEIGGFGGLDG